MIPRDLHFASFSAFIWLIALIPLLLVMLLSAYHRKKSLKKLADPSLWHRIAYLHDPFRMNVKMFLLALGWFFAVIALMQPQGNEKYLNVRKSQEKKIVSATIPLDLFLMIDTSQSMAVKDGRDQRSRLEMAKEIADQFVAEITSDQVALAPFTSTVDLMVPLTFDRVFVRLMLREMSYNEGDSTGTDYFAVLKEMGENELKIYPKRPKAILFFSDGGDNQIEIAQGENRKKLIEDLSGIAKGLNVPIFSIGIGTKQGGDVPDIKPGGKPVISKLQEDVLKAIGESSKGMYFDANAYNVQELALQLKKSLDQYRTYAAERLSSTAPPGIFTDYFQIPLAFACLFFLMAFLLPETKGTVALFLIAFPLIGYAEDPGYRLYDAKNYKEAAEWYDNELDKLPPLWMQDKLFYDASTSFEAAGEQGNAFIALHFISPEAYSFPVFREHIVNNLIYMLLKTKPQTAKWFYTLYMDTACQEGCELQAFQDLFKNGEKKFDLEDAFLETKFLADWPVSSPNLSLELSKNLPKVSDLENVKGLIEKGGSKNYLDASSSLLLYLLKNEKDPALFLEKALALLALNKTYGYYKDKAPFDIVKEASIFYTVAYLSQIESFKKGHCQCTPWNQVIPLFSDGLAMLRLGTEDPKVLYTYKKWMEALKTLRNPPARSYQSPQEQREALSDVSELQTMEQLDQEAKPQKSLGPNAKW